MNHMEKTIALGADIGGSHIACGAIDTQTQSLLPGSVVHEAIDNQWPAEKIIAAWANALLKVVDTLPGGLEKVAGIGLAMPGPFDYVQGIGLFAGNNKKFETLYGLPVGQLLRAALSLPDKLPIRFVNDATAFAIGEHFMGAAQGSTRSLCITLGTGFGSAFLQNGLPVTTGAAVPDTGALWHLPFAQGNADDYFSTRGLLQRYKAATGSLLSGVKELATLAATQPVAAEVLAHFGAELGHFLAPWLQRFQAEVLVIGGNISHAFGLFGEPLQKSLQEHNLQVSVRVAQWHEAAALLGGAMLVDEDFYQQLLPVLSFM